MFLYRSLIWITLLSDQMYFTDSHNISGDINTIKISGNEWNTTVQVNMTYEFSITPVNMFTNGVSVLFSLLEFMGMLKEVYEI